MILSKWFCCRVVVSINDPKDSHSRFLVQYKTILVVLGNVRFSSLSTKISFRIAGGSLASLEESHINLYCLIAGGWFFNSVFGSPAYALAINLVPEEKRITAYAMLRLAINAGLVGSASAWLYGQLGSTWWYCSRANALLGAVCFAKGTDYTIFRLAISVHS